MYIVHTDKKNIYSQAGVAKKLKNLLNEIYFSGVAAVGTGVVKTGEVVGSAAFSGVNAVGQL